MLISSRLEDELDNKHKCGSWIILYMSPFMPQYSFCLFFVYCKLYTGIRQPPHFEMDLI